MTGNISLERLHEAADLDFRFRPNAPAIPERPHEPPVVDGFSPEGAFSDPVACDEGFDVVEQCFHGMHNMREGSRVSTGNAGRAGRFPRLTTRALPRNAAIMMHGISMDLVRALLEAEIAKPGGSARGLSLRAELGPDAVRDILRGKSKTAQIGTLAGLAKALGGDLSMFASVPEGAAPPPPPAFDRLPRDNLVNFAGELVNFAGGPPPFQLWPKDIPVWGTAIGSEMSINGVRVEQTSLETFDIVEMVRRPPSQAGNAKLYALYVAGSSMEPRHEPGDLVYVDPRRAPQIGDDVVVQLRDGNGHDGDERVTCALIKRLVRRTADGVELEQYNPPARFVVEKKHISAMHRVVRLSELATV